MCRPRRSFPIAALASAPSTESARTGAIWRRAQVTDRVRLPLWLIVGVLSCRRCLPGSCCGAAIRATFGSAPSCLPPVSDRRRSQACLALLKIGRSQPRQSPLDRAHAEFRCHHSRRRPGRPVPRHCAGASWRDLRRRRSRRSGGDHGSGFRWARLRHCQCQLRRCSTRSALRVISRVKPAPSTGSG